MSKDKKVNRIPRISRFIIDPNTSDVPGSGFRSIKCDLFDYVELAGLAGLQGNVEYQPWEDEVKKLSVEILDKVDQINQMSRDLGHLVPRNCIHPEPTDKDREALMDSVVYDLKLDRFMPYNKEIYTKMDSDWMTYKDFLWTAYTTANWSYRGLLRVNFSMKLITRDLDVFEDLKDLSITAHGRG